MKIKILFFTTLCFFIGAHTFAEGSKEKSRLSKSIYSSVHTDTTFPVQEFHLFTQLDDNIQTSTVTVRYKDYEGIVHSDGEIQVPESQATQISQLFAALFDKNFLIQRIKPYTQYENIYEAMKDNTSFLFYTEGRTWLVINPLNNPLIVRDASNTQVTADEKHTHTLTTTQSNVLAIFPASGVLSVNVNETTNIGKITEFDLPLFTQYDFTQVLQPDNNENELFFGLFAYQNKTPSETTTATVADIKNTNDSYIFKYGPLPDAVKKDLINKGTWKKGCPVDLDRLSYVQFGYHDFDTASSGQAYIISADVVAPEVLGILKNFYDNNIPLEKPGSAVGGTGMFNCRPITGALAYSLHSYGTALDLSFYRNPYVGIYKIPEDSKGIYATGSIVTPASKLIFLARNHTQAGFNEEHADYITSQGLSEWGGTWLNRTDYMHFQTSPFFSYVFPLLTLEEGRTLFALEKTSDAILHKFSLEVTEVAKWQLLAQLYPNRFGQSLVDNISQFETLGEDGLYKLLYTKLQAKAE